MHRSFRTAALVLFAVFVTAGCGLLPSNVGLVASAEQIQIGTYNLEFFTDLNRATGAWCEQHTKHTIADIKALAAFIDSLDIEVLALQEVEDAAALNKLLAYMPPNKYRYIISRQKNQCQRVAVLYQPKKVSLKYQGEIPLNPPGHTYLRDALVVTGKVPHGFDFTLVVVHLKAYSDPTSVTTRDQQLRMLGTWVSNYLSTPTNDPDLILAGDFNSHLLTNAHAFALLSDDLGLKDLDQDSPNKTCTPPGRYYTDPIDHIIISPNAENEYTGTTQIDNYFTNSTLPYRQNYSDHCVLWSDFSTSDLDGAVQTPSTTAGAGKPNITVSHPSSTPHIVINEVEMNPPGSDAGNEWVELYNPGNKAVDLSGWQLSYTGYCRSGPLTCWELPLYGVIIPPKGRYVYTYHKMHLNNSNGWEIALRNNSGVIVDETPQGLKDRNNDARTWQRIPDGYDTDSSSDWEYRYATKGAPN